MAGTAVDRRRKLTARFRLRRRADRVWILTLALAALTAWLLLGPIVATPPLAKPHLPWWLIAIAFAAAERCVVHLHYRGGAHSFSLSDVALVFGLIFCRGADLVIAWILASTIVLALDRRLPPVKLLFNITQFGSCAAIAVLVMHALVPAEGQITMATWLAALIATQASALATVLLIAGARSLAEGPVGWPTLARMLAMDAVVTVSNASLGVCGVLVTTADARALPLLGVPFGTLFLAYRAYLSERERQQQLEFVHEANRTLVDSREVTEGLESLLERSLEAFRVEDAEVVLLGSPQLPPLRTLVSATRDRESMQPFAGALADELCTTIAGDGKPVVLERPVDRPALDRYLKERGLRNAIAAPLQGEGRVLGMILLANRHGVDHSFGPDDLKLLETLANNVSAAVEFDRLGHAVHQLSVARDQLQHQASHDSLTGLATRVPFVERVRHEVRAHPRDLAVLFIDLDNFKTVNDTLGHSAGDALLSSVAEGLRGCIRDDDLVARIGGDEFAIVLRGGVNAKAAATSVARRIVAACAMDVGEEAAISVNASVGVALCERREMSAEALIAEADEAMYSAKRSGKGQFHISGTDTGLGGTSPDHDPRTKSFSHQEVLQT